MVHSGMSVYFLQISPPVFMQFKESEGRIHVLFAFTKYLKYNLMEQMGVGNRIIISRPQSFSVSSLAQPQKIKGGRNDPERYWVWTFFFLLLFFGVARRDDTEKVGVGK